MSVMQLTQARKEEFLEMEIRGRFLMMACDIEWSMLNIMVHCAPDPLVQRDFKEMRMHNKIECTISDLKRHKPALYTEYEEELNKLWDFKEFRNKLAHRKIDFAPDLKSFKFRYVDLHEGKERIFEEQFTVADIFKGIEEFRKLNLSFAHILAKLTGHSIPH